MHIKMKTFQKIIGRILIVVLMLNVSAPIVLAETEPETACTAKKPDYEALKDEFRRIGILGPGLG